MVFSYASHLALGNTQKRAIYECAIVQPYREQDSILDADGDLHNEYEDPDVDMNAFKERRESDSWRVTSSTRAESGSLMLVDQGRVTALV